MSACPSPRQLDELLDERLDVAVEQALLAHVETCRACQEALERLTSTAPPQSAEAPLILPTLHLDDSGPGPDYWFRLKGVSGAPSDTLSLGLADAVPAPPTAWPTIPGYEILDELGRGGMGVVYKARQLSLQRVVALKVIDQRLADSAEFLERFSREMRLTAHLAHPNLVAVHDAGQANGAPYFVMEFVCGLSLSQLLRQHGHLPVPEACEVARQAALGLRHLHEHNLVHRDIKPSNLFLTPGGLVKVLDLGLVLLRTDSAPGDTFTTRRQSLGTIDYMAPEQWDDSHAVDIRADIYSLGCTLYHLLVGRPPFPDTEFGSMLRKMWAHGHTTVPPLRAVRPDVPEGLAAVVARMLAKDRTQRYPDPAKVAAALAPFAAGADLPGLLGAPPAPGPPLPPPAPRRPRRTRALAGGALLALLIGACLLWLTRAAWFPSGEADRADPVGPPAGPPIKVGVLHSLSGTMAISEKPVVEGVLLAIEELNRDGGLLGRPVELILADGRSDESTFAAEAEALIAQHQVCAVFGCWTSASRKAVKAVVEKHGHLLVYPVQYEGLEQSAHVVYVGAAPNQQIIPAVKWCRAFLNKKRLFLVGSDYVFPHTANAIIRDEVATLGGQIVGEEYLPLGSSRVEDIVRKIADQRPDAILNTINGDSNVPFFRALRAAGITAAKTPTISFSITEEELSHLGARDIVGDFAAWNYFRGLERPQNEAFVRRFQTRFGPRRTISDPVEAAYVGTHLWAQAVKQAGRPEPAAVLQAIKGQSFEAPEGPVRIDPDNLHTWKTVRIGQIRADANFEVVYSSARPVRPEPYPPSRSRADWDAFLADLFRRWHGHWVGPDR